MKVIRNEDKNSNKYIVRFEVEKGTIQKNTRKNASAVEIKAEDYNDLVVYMADGSKPRYANVEENKIKVLKLMRDQHLRNKKELEKLKNKKIEYLISCIGFFIAGGVMAGIMSSGIPNPNYMLLNNILDVVLPTVFLVPSGISTIKTFKTSEKIKEIKKNDYLLENEEVLNKADLENENILENIRDKDKAAIAKIKQEKDKENDKHYFDINSIDKLSLATLKEIKANIERENYLGLVTVQEEVKDNTESKGRPYVKK